MTHLNTSFHFFTQSTPQDVLFHEAGCSHNEATSPKDATDTQIGAVAQQALTPLKKRALDDQAAPSSPTQEQQTPKKPLKETPQRARAIARRILTQAISPEMYQEFAKRRCLDEDLYGECSERRHRLSPGTASLFSLPMGDTTHEIVIGDNSLSLLGSVIGSGSFSNVNAASTIPLEGPQAGQVMNTAIKISELVSLRQEATLLSELLADPPADEQAMLGIDRFEGVYQAGTTSLSIHQRFETNLDDLDYQEKKAPMQFLLPRLIQALRGLQCLHDKGYVHRDIKGANILINQTAGERIAAITDFNFLMKETRDLLLVRGTALYFAPFIFPGFENQFSREGHQTTKADCFAFGRTLWFDVLLKLLQGISTDHPQKTEIDALLETLQWKFETVTTHEQFLRLQEHPERYIYLPSNKTGDYKFYCFPERDEALQNILKAISYLETSLPPEELFVLQEVAKLAYDLQNPIEAEVPTISATIERLVAIEKR